jgi:hypothetical protein
VKDDFQATEIKHVDVEFGACRRHANSRVCGVAHVKPRRCTLCVGDNRIFQPEIRRRTDAGNRVFYCGVFGDLFREIGAPGNRFGIFSGYMFSYDAVFNCVNTS